MFHTPKLFFLTLLLLCGVFSPAQARQTPPKTQNTHTIVSLERQGNRVLCPITVEGQKLRLVLDTGAHGIVLQNAALKRLHLSARGTANLHGINGVEKTNVYQAKTVELGVFTGKFAFSDVPIYSMGDIDEDFDGLLGIDFFRGAPITWDLQANELQVAQKSTVAEPSQFVVPFKTASSSGIFVPVALDEEKGWILLDSGSDTTFFTERTARTVANAKGIEPAKTWTPEVDGVGQAQAKTTLSEYEGNFALRMDGFSGLPFGLTPLTAASPAEGHFSDLEKINHTGLHFVGILGMPFVDQFRAITFDWQQKTLTFDGINFRSSKSAESIKSASVTVERPVRFFVPNGGQLFANDTAKPLPVSPGQIVVLPPRMRLEFFAPPSAEKSAESPREKPAP